MSNMSTPPEALKSNNPDFLKGYESRLNYIKAIKLNIQKTSQNIKTEEENISFTFKIIEELQKSLDYLCKSSKIMSLKEYKNILSDIDNLYATIKKYKIQKSYLESVLVSDRTSLNQANKELRTYIASNKTGEVLEFKRRG